VGEYQTAVMVFLLVALVVATDWLLARKKKDGVTPTDWRRFRGMLGIGAILAVATWFLGQTI
jgi:hypothetical protein